MTHNQVYNSGDLLIQILASNGLPSAKLSQFQLQIMKIRFSFRVETKPSASPTSIIHIAQDPLSQVIGDTNAMLSTSAPRWIYAARGIDTEFERTRLTMQYPALIQPSDAKNAYLVDPLAIVSISLP